MGSPHTNIRLVDIERKKGKQKNIVLQLLVIEYCTRIASSIFYLRSVGLPEAAILNEC